MSTAVTVTVKRSFYEKILLNLLSGMKQGLLEITMPSGEMVKIGDGNGITAGIVIRDPDFFRRCVLYGDIGFGECYVDGLWETDNITDVIRWFLLNIDQAPSVSGSKARAFILNILKFVNRFNYNRRANSLTGSKKNIAEHYDLNNAFFSLFLDPTMTYSSARFTNAGMSLEEAQAAKYELLCRKLCIEPGDHVLEIGSGWGANAIYMAGNYGCRVTTITISEEQYKLAKERIKNANLDDRVTVLLQDYRSVQGSFDKIVSIEMLEAVGADYFETFFRKCADVLKKDGILAFQVITCPDSRFESLRKGVDWIQKHIFPGSLLPSVGAINQAVNHTSDLTLLDLEEFGRDYARTLSEWRTHFNARLDDVKELGFSDKFIRKWNYYLCYCEAAFAMRNIYVMQMVYSRPNNLK